MIMSRRDLEELLGCKLTDEEWNENLRTFSEVSDRMWDEDHPMDE